MFQSLSIADALYEETDWINFSKELKNDFIFILRRSRRPLVVSAGPIGFMSFSVFVTVGESAVFKSAYRKNKRRAFSSSSISYSSLRSKGLPRAFRKQEKNMMGLLVLRIANFCTSSINLLLFWSIFLTCLHDRICLWLSLETFLYSSPMCLLFFHFFAFPAYWSSRLVW